MELIKDLPEVFEEFAEQRQKSFLAVKELKEKGFRLLDRTVHTSRKRLQWRWGQDA